MRTAGISAKTGRLANVSFRVSRGFIYSFSVALLFSLLLSLSFMYYERNSYLQDGISEQIAFENVYSTVESINSIVEGGISPVIKVRIYNASVYINQLFNKDSHTGVIKNLEKAEYFVNKVMANEVNLNITFDISSMEENPAGQQSCWYHHWHRHCHYYYHHHSIKWLKQFKYKVLSGAANYTYDFNQRDRPRVMISNARNFTSINFTVILSNGTVSHEFGSCRRVSGNNIPVEIHVWNASMVGKNLVKTFNYNTRCDYWVYNEVNGHYAGSIRFSFDMRKSDSITIDYEHASFDKITEYNQTVQLGLGSAIKDARLGNEASLDVISEQHDIDYNDVQAATSA